LFLSFVYKNDAHNIRSKTYRLVIKTHLTTFLFRNLIQSSKKSTKKLITYCDSSKLIRTINFSIVAKNFGGRILYLLSFGFPLKFGLRLLSPTLLQLWQRTKKANEEKIIKRQNVRTYVVKESSMNFDRVNEISGKATECQNKAGGRNLFLSSFLLFLFFCFSHA
jgi:hypothetical protein